MAVSLYRFAFSAKAGLYSNQNANGRNPLFSKS